MVQLAKTGINAYAIGLEVLAASQTDIPVAIASSWHSSLVDYTIAQTIHSACDKENFKRLYK